LIANAKFTEEGSIQLTIKEIASDDDAISTIKFSVKDTVYGDEAESGENIPFFCARRSFYYSKIWWNRFRFGNFNQLLELMNSKLLLKSKYGKEVIFIDF
jgi:hypothetical protein